MEQSQKGHGSRDEKPGALMRVFGGLARIAHAAGLVKQAPHTITANAQRLGNILTMGSGWMAAGEPIQPKEPDGTAPRRFQYPPGSNIAIQPRHNESITFGQLRSLSEYTLVRIIIERIKEALKAHEWDIVCQEKGAMGFEQDITTALEFFEKPDRRNNWDEWLGQLIEEVLTIDALSIYRHKDRIGRLWALEIIDGGTIKPLVDERGFEPLPPLPAYQQFLYGTPYINFTRDDLIYRPRNRRATKFYGFSPVEQIVIIINMGIRRELYDLAQFTDGNIPPALATLPAEWKPEEVKQWNEYWNAILAGDPQNRSRLRWIPGGSGAGNVTKFHDEETFGLFNKFDEWLARVAAYSFGMSPATFVTMTNRAVAQEMGDVEAEQGFASVKMFVERLINEIIDHDLRLPHLQFQWITDRSRLQAKRVSANVEYVKVGIKSIDEVREEDGLPPIGVPHGVITGSGLVPFNQPQQDAGGVRTDPMTGRPLPPTPEQAAQMHLDHTAREREQQQAQPSVLTRAWAKCRDEELSKWERFASGRAHQFEGMQKGAHLKEFACEYVLPDEAEVIRGELAKAKLPHEISLIFQNRRKAHPVLRIQPPRAGDAAHLKGDLAIRLRSLLEGEAIRMTRGEA